ncbi:MAG: class I SAM-dependent methyltransferase [Bacteroidota bacterium]
MTQARKRLVEELADRLSLINTDKGSDTNEGTRVQMIMDVCDDLVELYGRQAINNVKKLVKHYLNLNYSTTEIIESVYPPAKATFDRQIEQREKHYKFDEIYGTNTTATMEMFELDESITVDWYENAVRYVPSPTDLVEDVMASLNQYGVSYSDYSFIDIGAGMGRAAFLAARYDFKEVIGVELSEKLHNIAVDNYSKVKLNTNLRSDITFINQNALEFDFPLTNSVYFFYWPFEEPVSTPFVNILESHIDKHHID